MDERSNVVDVWMHGNQRSRRLGHARRRGEAALSMLACLMVRCRAPPTRLVPAGTLAGTLRRCASSCNKRALYLAGCTTMATVTCELARLLPTGNQSTETSIFDVMRSYMFGGVNSASSYFNDMCVMRAC